MTSDLSQAVAFLQRLAPAGPWVVTALSPNGKGQNTRTFRPETLDGLKSWLAEYAGRWNCYYAANPLLRDVFGSWLVIKHKSEGFAEVTRKRAPANRSSPGHAARSASVSDARAA